MKSFLRQLLTAFAILVTTAFGLFVPNGVSRNDAQQPPRPKASAGEQAKEWLINQRAYPLKSIPANATMNGWLQSIQAIAPTKGPSALTTADHWTEIGPATIIGGQIVGSTANPRVTGRIVDIAVHPTQPDHWFVAADSGGIWETTDAGTNWAPKTDAVVSLGMSTITLAPSNPSILFAGTHDIGGVGIALLKSIDGGINWAPTGSFQVQGYYWFVAVKVDPTNPNIVLVMTFKGLDQGNGGVLKSTDGGATFSPTPKLPGGGTSLQTNPANFSQQYAGIRNLWNGFPNQYNGVFRSFNGGDTWTKLTGTPWDSAIAIEGGAVRISVAPSDPNTVYVVVPGGGIWRTQNAWAFTPTWTALTLPPGGLTYADTTMVDPTNPSIFYFGTGGEGGFFRLNANGTWTSIINSTHVDQHALAATGSTVLLGNDGGFWTSTDQGATWNNKNSNLATVQFYAGSLHPTNALSALGGSQDNGSELWTGPSAWDFAFYGDGGPSAFAYTGSDPDHNWLVTHIFLSVWKAVVTGGPPYPQYVYPAGTGIDQTGAAFIAPLRRSPHGNVVVGGTNNLWKSTNFFSTPTPTWSSNGPEEGVEIGAVAFAPFDTLSLTYAYGVGNGVLKGTTSGGAARWKDLDPAPGTVPNRYVKAIAYHPTDPNTMYVALSGFDEGTPGAPGHIFKTTNATAATPTWSNVSPSVNMPMNALAINPASPNTIFAGADLGVWKSTNGGTSWSFMGPTSGMPNVPVLDLLYSPVDGCLTAFTYGRGAFKLNVGSLKVTIVPPAAVTAGARWKVDGGAWQTSETTVSGLSPGNHTVSFGPAPLWQAPADQTVSITVNQKTELTGTYLSNQ